MLLQVSVFPLLYILRNDGGDNSARLSLKLSVAANTLVSKENLHPQL